MLQKRLALRQMVGGQVSSIGKLCVQIVVIIALPWRQSALIRSPDALKRHRRMPWARTRAQKYVPRYQSCSSASSGSMMALCAQNAHHHARCARRSRASEAADCIRSASQAVRAPCAEEAVCTVISRRFRPFRTVLRLSSA